MKTVGIVQARMGASRLPGKVLLPAAGKPLLQHMIERLRRCETLTDIVVATPYGPENEPIWDLLHELNVKVFCGSEDDVLSRVLEAAQTYGAELIVELTGDCPLVDPAIVDEAVRRFLAGQDATRKIEFASTSRPSLNHRNVRRAYPPGMDVRVFRTGTLEQVDRLTKDPADREHVSLYIWEHQRRFWCHDLLAPEGLADDVRLTVDTLEDYELVRTIFERFAPRNDFSLTEILNLLEREPELRKINAHVEQKAAR